MSTIRESLAANMAKMTGAESAAPTSASPEASAEGSVPADTHQMEQTAAVVPEAASDSKGARDEKGRFAPRTAAPEPAKKPLPTASAKQEAPAEAAQEEPSASAAHKPPAAMRASIREHWGKVPAEVQAEIVRIDAAHQQKMREAAGHQKAATALEETIRPYRDVLGPEPMKDISALLQTASALRKGDKEAVVAQIINGFGVDVGRLASILEGKAQPRQATPEYRDPRVDDLFRRIEEQEQTQAGALQEKMNREVSAFREKAEFFDDVQEEMVIILQRAKAKGEQPSLQQVYERACVLNDDVRPLYQQRKAAEAASARAPTPARKPSTSLRNEPTTPSPAPKPSTIREHIEAARQKLASR